MFEKGWGDFHRTSNTESDLDPACKTILSAAHSEIITTRPLNWKGKHVSRA